MKDTLNLLLLIAFLCVTYSGNGQESSWREGEMEVEVQFRNANDLELITNQKFNGDITHEFARLYLTPKEFQYLESTNIPYRISIPDLNEHYRDFWQSRDAYHSYGQIIDIMDSLALNFPGICHKSIIGYSIGGREIAVLKISDNVILHEADPDILLDGGIHGDEIGGAENLIRFAMHLCDNYGSDPYITELIDNREIWILPMINPDGRENMSRYNMNGIDLNRDFGYMWDGWGSSPEPYSQVETKAIRDFIFEESFNLQVSYHSGLEIFIYPWFYRNDPCPDHSEADAIGLLYSTSSGYDSLQYSSGGSLYATKGSSVEISYGIMGILGTAMELSEDKQPHDSLIQQYYSWNVEPMFSMIEQAGYGLAGKISDSISGEPLAAIIKVEEKMPVYTYPATGDYQKYLLPGNYDITIIADGYATKEISDIAIHDSALTILDVLLSPVSFRNYAHRLISCQIPGGNYSDEGNTAAVTGEPDGINYSIGFNGWAMVDMKEFIVDKLGDDIIIHEGDYLPEGFSAYASTDIDGPWEFLGKSSSTAAFDMSLAGLDSLRFVKVVDDGNGSLGVNAGYDLDAVSDVETPAGISLGIVDYEIDDSNGNGNGRVDAGETVYIQITLGNYGLQQANNVDGELSCQSAFININQNTAFYGNLAFNQTFTNNFTFTADASTPVAQAVTLVLTVTSDSGTYTESFNIELLIGKHPVMIVDLDGNNNSGPAMEASMQELGITPIYTTSFPETPESSEIIFLCLGITPDNTLLNTSQGKQLAAFLDNGGRLYMEGGDTWFDDIQTEVQLYFYIFGMSAGNGDLGVIMGMDGTFTSGTSFAYSGDNASIDRLMPDSTAFTLFRNQLPAYFNNIAFEGDNYKTIGSSFEFGGLVDGIHTKTELMEEILIFFDGLPLGINEIVIENNIQVKCYPNPSAGEVIIEIYTYKNNDISIDIFNLAGQNVKSYPLHTTTEPFSKIVWQGENNKGTRLPDGLYLLKIQTKNTIISKKIIIHR